jgi:hypothetical protein
MSNSLTTNKKQIPPLFVILPALIALALFFLGIAQLVIPQANKPINCGCVDTFSHVLSFSNTYWNSHHSFGTNSSNAVSILSSQGFVYRFTTSSSNSVDDVSVLVGGNLPKSTWEILALKGVGNYCFEALLIKQKNSNLPWQEHSPGTYYGYYPLGSNKTCRATFVTPQNYALNKVPS